MTTCSYISVLVIRQDIVYTANNVVCMKHHTYLLLRLVHHLLPQKQEHHSYPLLYTQAGSPPVNIETRASFLSCFPTCYHRNKTYPLPMEGVPHLLLKKNCYSLLRLFLTFYSNRNKGKVGNTLVIPRTQEYIVHLKHGNHVWDYIPGVQHAYCNKNPRYLVKLHDIRLNCFINYS